MAGSSENNVSPDLWWWLVLGISGFFLVVLLLSLLLAWCCVYHPCDAEYYSRKLAQEEHRKRKEKRLRERKKLRKVNGGLGKFPQGRLQAQDTARIEDHQDADEDHEHELESPSAKPASDNREISPTSSDDSQRPRGATDAATASATNPLVFSATETSTSGSHRGNQKTKKRTSVATSMGTYQQDGLSSTFRELDEIPQGKKKRTSSLKPPARNGGGEEGVVRKTLPLPSQAAAAMRDRSPARPGSSTSSAARRAVVPPLDNIAAGILGGDAVPRVASRTSSSTRLAHQPAGKPPSPQPSALVQHSQISPRKGGSDTPVAGGATGAGRTGGHASGNAGLGAGHLKGHSPSSMTLRRIGSLGSASAIVLPDGTRASRPKSRTSSHVTFLDHADGNEGAPSEEALGNDAAVSSEAVREAMPSIPATRELPFAPGAASVPDPFPPAQNDYYSFAAPAVLPRRSSSPELGASSQDRCSTPSHERLSTHDPLAATQRGVSDMGGAAAPHGPSTMHGSSTSGVDEGTSSSFHNSVASTQTPLAGTGTATFLTQSSLDASNPPSPPPPPATTRASSLPSRQQPAPRRSPERSTRSHLQRAQAAAAAAAAAAAGSEARRALPVSATALPPPPVPDLSQGLRSMRSPRTSPVRGRQPARGLEGSSAVAAPSTYYYPDEDPTRRRQQPMSTSAGADVYDPPNNASTDRHARESLSPLRGVQATYPSMTAGGVSLPSPTMGELENPSFVSDADTIPAAPILRENENFYASAARGRSSPRGLTPSPPMVAGPLTPTPRQRSAERNGTMPPAPPVVLPSHLVDRLRSPPSGTAGPLGGGYRDGDGNDPTPYRDSNEAPNSGATPGIQSSYVSGRATDGGAEGSSGRGISRGQSPPRALPQRRASVPTTTQGYSTGHPDGSGLTSASSGTLLTAAALASHRNRSASLLSGIRVLKITPAPGDNQGQERREQTPTSGAPEAAFNALGSPQPVRQGPSQRTSPSTSATTRDHQPGKQRPPLGHAVNPSAFTQKHRDYYAVAGNNTTSTSSTTPRVTAPGGPTDNPVPTSHQGTRRSASSSSNTLGGQPLPAGSMYARQPPSTQHQRQQMAAPASNGSGQPYRHRTSR